MGGISLCRPGRATRAAFVRKEFAIQPQGRLGGDETIGLSKRVNYRELVRTIRWRRIDSTFEADWVYYEAARIVFPQTYRGMVGFRPAWFIHVNPETSFPRYIKTTDLSRSGVIAGPLADKHAAARLIALVEDAFDLCRYYQILTEAPNGKACTYKEMGKCPAPCDGSISMEQYHRMIQWSVETLIDPAGGSGTGGSHADRRGWTPFRAGGED